jgi:micrococcal nuclease
MIPREEFLTILGRIPILSFFFGFPYRDFDPFPVNFAKTLPARFREIHYDPHHLNRFVLAVFFIFLGALLWPTPTHGKTIQGKVVKVFDGDTLLIEINGRVEPVRLREIDAPEVAHQKRSGQEPWGSRAKRFVQKMAAGKTVSLNIEETDERDPYHRVLAYVFLDQTFVNQAVLRSGNAFYYPAPLSGRYAADLQRAEEMARENGLGVWDKNNGLQERPEEFRNRSSKDGCLFSSFRSARGHRKERPSFTAKDPVPENKVVANQRSKIYHLPGTPGAARVSPQNRILFDTAEEAEKAGFQRTRPRGA